MNDSLSRREWIKVMGAAGAGAAGALGTPALALGTPPATLTPPILPLTSSSDVFVPGKGSGFQKFSFDFPEPSVELWGLKFGFRVFTRENIYGLDLSQLHAEAGETSATVSAAGLVWAGGQERAPGKLTARFRKNGDAIEWDTTVELDRPVKSVATVIRGIPRGRLSAGGAEPFDPKDDEVLWGYPFGAGDLFGGNTAWGLGTPMVAVLPSDTDVWTLSSIDDRVRAKRFYFQPGEAGYRVEAVFEAEGWKDQPALAVPTWRIARTRSLVDATQAHYAQLERAYGFPAWETRADVPAWLRDVALVVSLHGAHYTGYIFNDFARMLEILRWVAGQIPAARVLVFLPAWDGRYYWSYPLYRADPRMGGEAGLKALVTQGQRLGFRFMPMFGMNAATRRHPEFAQFADAATERIDGDPFNLNWVDWDNDRHQEGWGAYMNLGVDSWRNWLSGRIADVIDRYGVDGYFLDISGGWMNNTKADMHEGTRRLVADLRSRYPRVLCCGEFSYDALLSFIPLFHVYSPHAVKYVRAFEHLSHPAPGRGSSGVHESGFNRWNQATFSVRPGPIPTLSVVDDTFTKYRAEMTGVIARAKQMAGIT
jgi:hypothetical protein